MTEYEIRVSEPAEIDIENAFQYLFLRSPSRAEDWKEGIYEAVRSLTTLPERCSLVPERLHYDREVRQLWFGTRQSAYRIVFTVFEETTEDVPYVWILRVRHHAQKGLFDPNPTD